MARVFNQWSRQSYVMKGQAFPDPNNVHLDIKPTYVTWRWWGQINEVRAGDLTVISV